MANSGTDGQKPHIRLFETKEGANTKPDEQALPVPFYGIIVTTKHQEMSVYTVDAAGIGGYL